MAIVQLVKEEGFAVITMNKPEEMNALNTKMLTALNEIIENVENDKDIKVVIITGAGKAFVAGADITEMQGKTVDDAYQFSRFGQQVFEKIESLSKPVIAAVNGFALGGGCELAMACDIRLASKKAKFGLPEVGLGIIPGFGGTQRLPRLVGKGKALELLMTAEIISADEAMKIGLVNHVIEGDTMTLAMEMARKIMSKGPLAIRYVKAVVHHGMDADLGVNIAHEAEVLGLCFATEDQKEGMTAFVEKRKPQFKGC